MSDRIFRYRLLLLGGFVLGLVLIWYPYHDSSSEDLLEVHFLDVGQGDAILIKTPDGAEMLIDGGRDSKVIQELSRYLPWYDREIDVVVATHPDLDHVAGLVDVLARYQVRTIISTEAQGESEAAIAFVEAVPKEGAELINATANQRFSLGASTTVTILSPVSDPSEWESNSGSIVLLVEYGEMGFMLTGDAPAGIENYLVNIYGETLEAEVLKLGHHGSETSSSPEFLATVDPLFAVVSAEKNSRYNHPHEAVLERVRKTQAALLSTQTSGTVSFFTDGQSVWVK